ncbi:TetR/AcrR family transcriptional regulator [Catenulispora yoronensis]
MRGDALHHQRRGHIAGHVVRDRDREIGGEHDLLGVAAEHPHPGHPVADREPAKIAAYCRWQRRVPAGSRTERGARDKGQLFHYFPGGKEELLLAVARHEAERVITDQQPHLGALTSWAAWLRWRNALIARYRAQGPSCPLGTLMDQVGTTPGAAEVATALLDRWQGMIRAGIGAIQADGLVDPRLDADRAAAAFLAGTQGGVLILRSTGESTHLEAAVDLLIDHLKASR